MTCCKTSGNVHPAKPTTLRGRLVAAVRWALPGVGLVLVPKCPMCLAAYVALGTGVSVGFTTAAYLRWAMLLVCAAALLYLTWRSARPLVQRWRSVKP